MPSNNLSHCTVCRFICMERNEPRHCPLFPSESADWEDRRTEMRHWGQLIFRDVCPPAVTLAGGCELANKRARSPRVVVWGMVSMVE